MVTKKDTMDFLIQQRKREQQLLSAVLECFEQHNKNTLKDLEVLKHNIQVKGGKE